MRSRTFLLLGALALSLGVLAAACGGGGAELTVEEYFQRVNAIFEDANDRLDSLGSEFEGAAETAETTEQQADVLREFVNGTNAIANDGIGAMDPIDPPEEAESAHREWLAASTALVSLLEDFVDRLTEVESQADLEEVVAELDGPEFTEAGDRGDQACFGLQTVADDNRIDVDLECGEE